MPLNVQTIRTLRERKGLTLEEAAQRAGFSGRQQWYMIESGRRSKVTPDTLLAMARALGVSMEELMVDPSATSKKRRAASR